MKVTVERAALLKSLSHLYRVVERRTTIPILSNVLLKAQSGALHLRATDLDLEVMETIAADVPRAGGTTVPAHVLYDIVRKLPDGAQVSLDLVDGAGQIVLTSGRSRFSLQALPVTDFPDLTAGDLPHRFRLAATDLKRLIEKTAFAISTEETRYYLNGIYLHTIEVENRLLLRAVATDGHRLALLEMPAPEPEGEDTPLASMPGVIIPRKAVAEIQKLLEGLDTEVTLSLSTAKIRLTLPGASGEEEGGDAIGAIVLTSKLIDGTFPDYQRVIPPGNDKRLVVERSAFSAGVDRVSTISSERARAVKLSLSSGRLLLTVTNPDSGNATEEVEVSYDASAIDIGFNARYLLDITAQLDGDEAVFTFLDAGSPTLVQDNKNTSALYVLMPMRV